MSFQPKQYKMVHWSSNDNLPEKRLIRKNSKGRCFDVFPQDTLQDEDNISSIDRIRKGFIIDVRSYEHDSFLINSQKTNSFGKTLENTTTKAFQFFDNIIKKKCLDISKNNKKNIFQKLFQVTDCNYKFSKTYTIQQFFEDLCKGKDSFGLLKKFPYFENKDNFLKYLFNYRVPISKAIWFIKIMAIFKATQFEDGKAPKKSQVQQAALEYVQTLISGYIIHTFKYFHSNNESIEEKIERWNYYALLIKHMFEEGVLDRQDFLTDMIDLLNEYIDFPLDGPTRFKLLFIFTSQFSSFITQNIILSRRMAFVICRRFRKYHFDYMNIMGDFIDCGTTINELLKCEHHRPLILSMVGILCCILTECIQAITYKYIHVDRKFCGIKWFDDLTSTPLEYLTCTFDIICEGTGRMSLESISRIKDKINEFTERSIDLKYMLHSVITGQEDCSDVTMMILNMFDALDTIYICNEQELKNIYEYIFTHKTHMKEKTEVIIKLRLLIHWCITSQRYGTERAAIVSKLLLIHFRTTKISSTKNMIEILNDYINTECPSPGYCNYGYEFRNFIHFLNTLQDYNLLSYKELLKNWIKRKKINPEDCLWRKTMKYVYGENYERDLNPSWNKYTQMSSRYALQFYRRDSEKHILINLEDVNIEERIFLQMPLLPSIKNRDDIIYRENIIYGISLQKKEHNNYLKDIARSITRVWKKLYFFKIKHNSNGVDFHEYHDFDKYLKSGDILMKFRRQTYFDQTLITYWVGYDFRDYLKSYIVNETSRLPGSDGLDYILRMFCISMNICGMIEFIDELLIYISKLEDIMIERRYNMIPGMLTKSYSFTIVGYLSEHFSYFLQHPKAPSVINGLYSTIENTIVLKGYPRTGYDMNIAMFIYYSKYILAAEEMYNVSSLGGSVKDIEKLYPLPYIEIKTDQTKIKPKKLYFGKYLKTTPQMLSHSELQKMTKDINEGGINSRLSFVLASLQAAKNLGRDINKLTLLGNYVANVSVHLRLENEWMSVILEMCSLTTNPNTIYKGVHRTVNIGRTVQHYPLSTFIMILAAKYVIRPRDLIYTLTKNTMISVFKGTYLKSKFGYEKVILAALICTKILTGYHDPFKLPKGYTGLQEIKRPDIRRLADFKACAVLSFKEINDVLYNFIKLLSLANRPIKNVQKKRPGKRIRINHFFKACLLCISEQNWFYQKISLCIYQPTDELIKDNFLNSNGLCGTLLKFISRSKADRQVKLQILSNTEKLTHKDFIEKTLDTLNIYNFKSVYWSLYGLLNDTERKLKDKNYAQKIFNSNHVMKCIAEGIKNMFLKPSNIYGENIFFKSDSFFRLKNISKLWLLKHLIDDFPKINIPQNDYKKSKISVMPLSQAVLIEFTYFLTESYSKIEYIKRTEQFSYILRSTPFVEILQSCANENLTHTHALLQGFYSYLTNIIKEFDSRRILSSQLINEKNGIRLRIIIISGLMEQLLTMPAIEPWAYLLWQLLYLEIIHPEKDKKCYMICYEALSTILFMSAFKVQPRQNEGIHHRARYWAYNHFCKRLRRECQDRPFPSNKKQLEQLLPLPKRTFDYIIFDNYYKLIAKADNVLEVEGNTSEVIKLVKRTGYYPVEKIKLTTFEVIPGFFHESLGRKTVNFWFYQANILDYSPRIDYNMIINLSYHNHRNIFPRAPIYGENKALKENFVYLQPSIEFNVTKEERSSLDNTKTKLINNSVVSPKIVNVPDKNNTFPIQNIQNGSNNVSKQSSNTTLKPLQINGEIIDPSRPQFNPIQQNIIPPSSQVPVQYQQNPMSDVLSYNYQQPNQMPKVQKRKTNTSEITKTPIKKRKDVSDVIPPPMGSNNMINPRSVMTQQNIIPQQNVLPHLQNVQTKMLPPNPPTNNVYQQMNKNQGIPQHDINSTKSMIYSNNEQSAINPMRQNNTDQRMFEQMRSNQNPQGYILPQQTRSILQQNERSNYMEKFDNQNKHNNMLKEMLQQKNPQPSQMMPPQYNQPINNPNINQKTQFNQQQRDMLYYNSQQQQQHNQIPYQDSNMGRINQQHPNKPQQYNQQYMYPR